MNYDQLCVLYMRLVSWIKYLWFFNKNKIIVKQGFYKWIIWFLQLLCVCLYVWFVLFMIKIYVKYII